MKKFVKIIALLSALAITVCCFAACGGKDDTATTVADSTTAAPATEKEVLVMGTNAQFPPYEFYDDNGAFAGIDVEIMGLIAEKLNMELKIEDMKFDSIIPAIQSGKVDVGAAGMSITEERLLSVNFTDNYTTAKQVIIVANDSAIKSADDFKDKKIGTQTGTTGDLYVTWDYEDEGLATVERYESGFEAVQALKQGKVDAVVIDSEPAKVFVAENEGLQILATEYVEEQYAYALNKENTELLGKVNTALNELIADGSVKAIIDKYIKAD